VPSGSWVAGSAVGNGDMLYLLTPGVDVTGSLVIGLCPQKRVEGSPSPYVHFGDGVPPRRALPLALAFLGKAFVLVRK